MRGILPSIQRDWRGIDRPPLESRLLRITTSGLAVAVEGDAYSETLSGKGGVAPYTWGIDGTGDALPTGLSLDTGTGAITGTPGAATAGAYDLVISLTDDDATVVLRALTLAVWEPAPVITNTTLDDPEFEAAYSDTVDVDDGTAPLVFTIQSGALPSGLSINSGTGAITGTPDDEDEVDDAFNFTIRATDAHGRYDDQAYTVTLQAAGLPASLDAFELLVEKPSVNFTAGATAVWVATKGASCQFEQGTGSAQPAFDATDDALDCAGDDKMNGDADVRSLLTSYDSFTTVWVGKFTDEAAQGLWCIENNVTGFYANLVAFDAGLAGYLTVRDRRDGGSGTVFARYTTGTVDDTLYCIITRHTRNGKLTLNRNGTAKTESAGNIADLAAVAPNGTDQPSIGWANSQGSLNYFLRGDVRLFGVKKGTVLTDGEAATLLADVGTYLGVTFT